jgi:hypothetical protein
MESFSITISFIGFTLVVLELYFPNITDFIEGLVTKSEMRLKVLLKRNWERIEDLHEDIGMGYILILFPLGTCLICWYIFHPQYLSDRDFDYQPHEIDPANAILIFFVMVIISIIFFPSLMGELSRGFFLMAVYFFYALFLVLVYLIVLIPSSIIRIANKLTNGKALGSIGLLVAVWELWEKYHKLIEIKNAEIIRFEIYISSIMIFLVIVAVGLLFWRYFNKSRSESQKQILIFTFISRTQVNKRKVKIYKDPFVFSDVISKISLGSKIEILGVEDKYFKISHQGIEGYIENKFIPNNYVVFEVVRKIKTMERETG